MTSVRIIKHESVPQTGSYEVLFPDGPPSVYQYFDDDPGLRSITGKMTGEEALDQAKALAGAARARLLRNMVPADDLPSWRGCSGRLE